MVLVPVLARVVVVWLLGVGMGCLCRWSESGLTVSSILDIAFYLELIAVYLVLMNERNGLI